MDLSFFFFHGLLLIWIWQASCTLEAGVKIYSARVDAVHSEAYKILIRMNQASLEDEQGSSLAYLFGQ